MALTDLDLAADSLTPASIKLAMARTGMPPISMMGSVPSTFSGNSGGFGLPVNFNSVLNRNGALPAAPMQMAPTQLAVSTRSQPIQQGIGQAMATRTTNQTQANQSLSDFVKEFLSSKGQVQQAAGQESAALGNIYGTGAGSLQQQLADINRRRTAAVNAGAQSAFGRAMRNNNVSRMQGGNSSYLDRVLMQQMGDIGASSAGQAADQERNDLQYLTGQRTANVGGQQAIIDRMLARNFMPTQAASEIEGMNLRNLGGLANLEYGNNIYERPEDAYLNRLNFYDILDNRRMNPTRYV